MGLHPSPAQPLSLITSADVLSLVMSCAHTHLARPSLIPILFDPRCHAQQSNKKRAIIQNMSINVAYTSGVVSVSRAVTIRAVNAIKTDGESYFEIAIIGEGRRQGTSLQGNNYVGIVAEDFSCWDGNWMYDEALRRQVWALQDSHAGQNGEICSEVRQPFRPKRGKYVPRCAPHNC